MHRSEGSDSVADAMTRTHAVKALAHGIGFDVVGIASAEPFHERSAIAIDRIRDGLMDGLPWYHEARVTRGSDPRNLLPTAKSIVSLALSYYYPDPEDPIPAPDTPQGRIARYAWGEDYHRVFARRIEEFLDRLPSVIGRPVQSKWYTDTGPMQDRAVAERAGLGWFGKNTNVLTAIGSWVLLAQVLTDVDLEPDAPSKKSCGSCTRCVDACPTGAIVAPGVLDNRLCISYLTIENRGAIPSALREQVGDWIFGCDICQDVCPVNRKATLGAAYREFSRDAEQNARPELTELLAMDEPAFRERFRGSPVLRAKLAGLKRNVCVALGNLGDPRMVPPLAIALREETSPIVRGHAAWALGRIGGDAAVQFLREALVTESDETVREELTLALAE